MRSLIALAALATVGVAVRQLYIQSLPAGSVPACGASLDFMLKVFSLSEVLVKVLTGSGECAKVTWRFLGLAMPGWVLIAALAARRLRRLGQSAAPGSGTALLMPDTLQLTQDLIARASVSPTDGGCQALMIGTARRPSALTVENLRFGPVDNFWAKRGRGGPVFCFAGHTDVVPPGPLDEWHSDPFVPVIRDGVLYGRGAADMKSGLAAMVTACEEFVGRHPAHRGTIAFLITSDEEGPSVDGTRRVVEVLREREQRHRLVPGRRALERERARRHHQDRPARQLERTPDGAWHPGAHRLSAFADNPVHAVAPALAELAARTWDQGNEHFQPTSFQVSNISAGTGAPNVIPGELKARFNLRFSTEQTVDCLKAVVEEMLQRHGVKYSLEWFVSGYPVPDRSRRTVAGREPRRAGAIADHAELIDRRRHFGRALHRADGRAGDRARRDQRDHSQGRMSACASRTSGGCMRCICAPWSCCSRRSISVDAAPLMPSSVYADDATVVPVISIAR